MKSLLALALLAPLACSAEPGMVLVRIGGAVVPAFCINCATVKGTPICHEEAGGLVCIVPQPAPRPPAPVRNATTPASKAMPAPRPLTDAELMAAFSKAPPPRVVAQPAPRQKAVPSIKPLSVGDIDGPAPASSSSSAYGKKSAKQ